MGKITLIKQTVTFTLTGGVAAYTGDVKDVYEKGYGKAIGIYDTTKKAYTKGCSVASTASTRRADIKVAFVASIDQSQAGFGATSAAQIAATGLTSTALKTAITQTNTALGKSVAAPTVKTVAKPTVTNAPIDPNLAALAAGLAGWAIAVIIISVFCCCCCPLIIFCACFGGMACCIGAAASSEQWTLTTAVDIGVGYVKTTRYHVHESGTYLCSFWNDQEPIFYQDPWADHAKTRKCGLTCN